MKYGWTVKGILGFIFLPMGFIFLTLGFILWKVGAGKKPGDPEIFLYCFGGIGAFFLLIGLFFLFSDLYRRYLLRRAYEGGQTVTAQIIGVRQQNNVNMNGRHPVTVECSYTDSSGIVHIYHSRYLYVNVEKLLTSNTVPVYIDRLNENIGFVDIDAVLPKIRVHQ